MSGDSQDGTTPWFSLRWDFDEITEVHSFQHSLQYLPFSQNISASLNFGQNISTLAEIFLKLLTSDVKKILKLLTSDVIVLNLIQTPTTLKYKFKNSVNFPKLQILVKSKYMFQCLPCRPNLFQEYYLEPVLRSITTWLIRTGLWTWLGNLLRD